MEPNPRPDTAKSPHLAVTRRVSAVPHGPHKSYLHTTGLPQNLGFISNSQKTFYAKNSPLIRKNTNKTCQYPVSRVRKAPVTMALQPRSVLDFPTKGTLQHHVTFGT